VVGAAQRRTIHYGWIIVAITSLTLLVAAGVRSAPGVMIHPLEMEFGWSRSSISFAVAIGLLLYGLAGPVAGALMDRFGPTRLMLLGVALTAISTALAAAISALWQLNLLWGVFSGLGTGIAATVLGATVANRWFVARRGLVIGIFGAATSAGQLLFVPLLMWIVTGAGWRSASLVLAACAAAMILPIVLFMRDDPAAVGAQPFGAPPQTDTSTSQRLPAEGTLEVMRRALRTPMFWLLAGSFFICGATSTGLIGTHFIPHSIDHGIPEATAAGTLALMGAMNFVGTIGSGYLTDRYDPRKLLAIYYTLRGLSLFILPMVTDFSGLAIFAVVFGLDYIATVPPTVVLASDIFGRRHVGIVFGWIFAAHQLGAALTAYLGGVARDAFGDYQLAFISAGALALLGGLMALRVERGPISEALPSSSPAPANA